MRTKYWTVVAMVLALSSSAFAAITNEDHFLASDTPGADEYDTSGNCGFAGYGRLRAQDAAPTGWNAGYVWDAYYHDSATTVGKYIVGGTGLSYTGLASSGGAIRYHADKASSVPGMIHHAERKTETRETKDPFYISFLVNFNDLIEATREGTVYKETIDFDIEGHSTGKMTQIGLEGGYGAGSDEAKVWLQTEGGTKQTTAGTYAGGSTMLLVLKLVADDGDPDSDDDAYLFINPDLSQGEPASADLHDTGNATAATGAYLMWFKMDIHNEAADGGRDLDVYVDELRAGETWGDVTIPEPATMALLGLGGIGVLIRRKRRQF